MVCDRFKGMSVVTLAGRKKVVSRHFWPIPVLDSSWAVRVMLPAGTGPMSMVLAIQKFSSESPAADSIDTSKRACRP